MTKSLEVGNGSRGMDGALLGESRRIYLTFKVAQLEKIVSILRAQSSEPLHIALIEVLTLRGLEDLLTEKEKKLLAEETTQLA